MHQRLPFPLLAARITVFSLLLIMSLTGLITAVQPSAVGVAAPGWRRSDQALHQSVAYLSPDDVAALGLDFQVLVPSFVPGPFGGEPAVSADGGSYSLYWMNPGVPPTFLQVSGVVGGALPAGSPADLNNELSINATVQGSPAIQDVTARYDAVWWVSGGVLYSVESLNMETDSLSLANSLVPYAAPDSQPPVEELPPDAGGGVLEPPTDVADQPAEGTEPAVDGTDQPVATNDVIDEQATDPSAGPDVAIEAAVAPQADVESVPATEPDAGRVAPTVEPQEGSTRESPNQPVEANPGSDGSGGAASRGSGESNVGSDGTGGAPLPVFGGDGTGGTRDLIVPEPDE